MDGQLYLFANNNRLLSFETTRVAAKMLFFIRHAKRAIPSKLRHIYLAYLDLGNCNFFNHYIISNQSVFFINNTDEITFHEKKNGRKTWRIWKVMRETRWDNFFQCLDIVWGVWFKMYFIETNEFLGGN